MLKRIALLAFLLLTSSAFADVQPAASAPVEQAAAVQVIEEDLDWPDWIALTSQALGIDEDSFWEAIDAEKTIAQLAEEKGVALKTIEDKLIAADTEAVNKMVADGSITQEEADEWLAELPECTKFFLEEIWEMEEDFMDDVLIEDFFEGADWFVITSEALGMDEETLWEATNAEKTITEIAQEAGVDVQTIEKNIIVAETDMINNLVADGTFTQEEADEWLAELPAEVKFFLEESWEMEILLEGPDWFSITGEALGVDEESMWEALDAGKSISQLASEKNISLQTIQDKLIAAETELIQQLVADNEISQEEADEWLSMIPEDVTYFLEESWEDLPVIEAEN